MAAPTNEELEAMQGRLREAVDLLLPARKELEAHGFMHSLEANETERNITLTIVVHDKWPTPEASDRS